MPQYSFPSANGYDPRRYINLQGIGRPSSATNTWVTVFSATGEGFLTSVIFSGNSSFTTGQARLTVDGVVKFEGSLSSNASRGLVSPLFITKSDTTTSSIYDPSSNFYNNSTGASAYNNGNSSVLSILSHPLFFYQSVLVEIFVATSGTLSYNVIGGKKI